jgi:Uma2 family endonuclease
MLKVNGAINGVETFAEFLEQLGDVPLDRIRMRPLPGTATEQDVLAAERQPRRRLCELVDGVLVEKAMGAEESQLACDIILQLLAFVKRHKLGIVLGEAGTLRLMPGLIRIPDVCFISYARLPLRRLPKNKPIPNLVPDLAIEVISPSNTKAEMKRKLRDYFLTGVQAAWLIYPKSESAEVYTSPTKKRRLRKNQTIDGGSLLPGFTLSLKELFDSLEG